MEKVLFTYANGRTRHMRPREAEILTKLKRGTYLTRDMKAQETTVVKPEPEKTETQPTITEAPVVDDLDGMDVDALRDMAAELDIPVHHRAGADKIRDAIREQRLNAE